ncbi:MAG: DUF192 domain-containing protein [Bdellovibrionales bacterium]|jgi:uncharacterized protein|nr:DUF192 domain-containing protein [Bdellovibrionales bacterium]MBT3525695.1 DUF192 domain-containing protein [Bdellovibrionales bacterium]MBT7670003.1 DUF192 domain-containing protein [Bdellovibrionales bacterium]MBT7766638.1 DUF192 domain-containing protein [Bdellovibrionales bacterium]
MGKRQTTTIKIASKEIALGKSVVEANTIASRMIGLLGTSSMNDFDGLLITKCNSIHTFFMKYDIDVIFLDSGNRIIQIIRSIKPWRITRIYFRASKVLELSGGTLDENVHIGDQVEICIN